jgi:hypothetical protein
LVYALRHSMAKKVLHGASFYFSFSSSRTYCLIPPPFSLFIKRRPERGKNNKYLIFPNLLPFFVYNLYTTRNDLFPSSLFLSLSLSLLPLRCPSMAPRSESVIDMTIRTSAVPRDMTPAGCTLAAPVKARRISSCTSNSKSAGRASDHQGFCCLLTPTTSINGAIA